MKNVTFNAGDIVQLKSGGPKMTISSGPDDYLYYNCQWFSGTKLSHGRFPLSSLVAYPIEEIKEPRKTPK